MTPEEQIIERLIARIDDLENRVEELERSVVLMPGGNPAKTESND